ncbi:NAD(P)H-binding protein [Hymenobacter sp. BT664]|uniref:NAD(P)H-binding protein n=1 Tax=Hymenobacter montanus TaxID=2771359 RepID=A0A927BDT9_9BACT|nr:NAD(P)H-binding protein [Hymenobacter montanus]MBD2768148.1 NAD(P)H-binding protein [Hymenobacter montanus]
MKVVIFGATGFSGNAILKEALARNHQVTILTRDRSSITINDSNLTIVEGNVMDEHVVAEILENTDAVIQCLGIGGKGSGKPSVFISEATKIIVEQMKKQKIKRLIAMSNVGAGDSIEFQPWIFTKVILPFFMKWLKAIIDDKNRMEPVIMNSELDWTIVRCPNIVAKPAKGSCCATLDGKGLKMSITLGDMAKFMIEQLDDNAFMKQAPSISN